MASALETYLRELRDIRSTGAGVKEQSYYPAIRELLNEVGKTLKPRVRCILHPASLGAGQPDGGLYTPDQFQKIVDAAPLAGQPPSRGVIEAKGTAASLDDLTRSEQVERYWKRYGLVLITNLREFALIGKGADGTQHRLETYRLAPSEAEFWRLAATPHAMAEEHGERFGEFLKRVMLHAAPLASPKDLAWFLASYARDAKARINAKAKADGGELPQLDAFRSAMEEALGTKFVGIENDPTKGERFFRSTLVQTLFYGVFSAWVLWCKRNPPSANADRFDWRQAVWSLHVPMIRALFERIATPSQLGPLDLVEVLDWTGAALNRVDRAAFFDRFNEEHAVQYFYEPFLQAFDPELRKDLGVWYTPPEVVQYMVARVDAVLRNELDIADGLADPRVYVLDPCCGTGTYLVEVIKTIAKTLAKTGDALTLGEVRKAAMERVYGFEIMPAPFVVAHLQIGLQLQRLGVPLRTADELPKGQKNREDERAGVFLTNALTGWDLRGQAPIKGMPELEEERRGSGEVKRERPILVVIGNPPYNAFAGVSPTEEDRLVDVYKGGYDYTPPSKDKAAKRERKTVRRYRLSDPPDEGGWGIKKYNLDDLYVRFFRIAERRIAEQSGTGIVCFISNYSYLSDPSFVIVRKQFLQSFDRIWIDCLNGDSRETGKLTPGGKPDPSIFSTEHNREGIRVGTAISLMVRRQSGPRRRTIVRFRQFWGTEKGSQLVASLGSRPRPPYEDVRPSAHNRNSFRPDSGAGDYGAWPRLIDLCAVPPGNGLMEKRGGSLIDIERDRLRARMEIYFDRRISWEDYRQLGLGLTEDQARFAAKAARVKAIAAESFDESRIVRYTLRPFEVRWCYYTGVRPIWNEPRPGLWSQVWDGNDFLAARPSGVAMPEGIPLGYTRLLGDNDAFKGHAYYFPIRLRNGKRLEPREHRTLFDVLGATPEPDRPVANLSSPSRSYLASLMVQKPDDDAKTAGLIWMHALAIGYSPAYLDENADGIRQDWPRIPLPAGREALLASAALGREVASLLDTESAVPGVISGTIRPELRTLGHISSVGGGPLGTNDDDLAVTVGWGHRGKEGVVMPGKGRAVAREHEPEEIEAIRQGARALGLSAEEALARLGPTTFDIYLNGAAYWKNVPARVWSYTIGGYQVIKKWLSYRERELLGRALRPDEAREVRDMIRRIAALALLEPALDRNYRAVTADVYPWSS